ncbi:MAG: prepilin-type N-terminal cleavage/methylation domain-containing protein [Planctomycetota bacterium]|nr:prepilin-type N-terminal cleavage/methylation domain-containing protein [Planctomycetota bacterium]
MRRSISKGFTLVEILIVVVILGILAAIVVPQFTNATQDAQTGNLRAQLKSLQNQIELFKARSNNGSYPALVADTDGDVAWAPMISANYIKAAPKNPFNGQDGVVLAANGNANVGWHYVAASGTLGASYFDEANDALTPNSAN